MGTSSRACGIVQQAGDAPAPAMLQHRRHRAALTAAGGGLLVVDDEAHFGCGASTYQSTSTTPAVSSKILRTSAPARAGGSGSGP